MNARMFALVALISVLCVAGTARADAIAFDADPASTFGLANWSGGYAFTVSSPVTIDSLLLFDHNGDGFAGISLVNIYLDNGTTTLAAPTLSAVFFGTSQGVYADDTPPGGVWRQFDIVDTVLAAGSYTIIAGLTSATDEMGYAPASIVAENNLTYIEQRSSNGGTSPLLNPTTAEQGFMTDGVFGPNFTVLVPTPAAALMALPIFGAMLIARRRRMA